MKAWQFLGVSLVVASPILVPLGIETAGMLRESVYLGPRFPVPSGDWELGGCVPLSGVFAGAQGLTEEEQESLRTALRWEGTLCGVRPGPDASWYVKLCVVGWGYMPDDSCESFHVHSVARAGMAADGWEWTEVWRSD